METTIRYRCSCGYEAVEKARPGYTLVAVHHIHSGPAGWGTHTFRMEPVSEPVVLALPQMQEMATVA